MSNPHSSFIAPREWSQTRLLLASHGHILQRQYLWRFENLGIFCQYINLQNDSTPNNSLQADLLILDLGWSPDELQTSLDWLFKLTSQFSRPPIFLLVPLLSSDSVPFWAELGVALALDRTTPPPAVVHFVVDYLQNQRS